MITYIIKAILFSALLLLIYRLFLEKEKMHRFNRFYLLLSIILPFLIPLIALPAISFMPQITGPVNLAEISPSGPILTDNLFPGHSITGGNNPGGSEVRSAVSQALPAAAEYNLWISLLFIGYLIVSLTLLYRFIRNILSIYYIVTNNKSLPYLNASLILTKDCRLPHSFLKYIFVNQKDFENGAIEKEILNHELIHVRQKHSLDILLVEFLMIFAWINPLLFFCRKAIRLNHEYLADQAVVEKYSDTKSYQLLLFEKARQSKCLSLSSPFNYLLTKKRIIMMSRKPSPGTAIFKQFAIMPLIIIAGLAFSAKGYTDDLTVTSELHRAGTLQTDNVEWALADRADASGNTFNEISGVFEGRMEDNDVQDIPVMVKVFITNHKGGEMFTEFYESGSEGPENLHKKYNQAFNFNTQSTVDIAISLPSGETIEMQQMVGGSHMWDFYHKPVPPPPGAPEGGRYGQFRAGDLLKLILELDNRVSIMVDFRTIPDFNNKIYRFDIDPAGLKELFEKL